MKTTRIGWRLARLSLLLMTAGTVSAERVPDKFIPTAALKYGTASTTRIKADELAKFDLLMVSEFHDRVWAEGDLSSWQALKRRNPDMVVLVYQSGPILYNTAPWGRYGDWDWMLANHGPDQPLPQRWISRGEKSGKTLAGIAYPGTRVMNLANTDWLQYYWQSVHKHWWGSGRNVGADGVFADNWHYTLPYQGRYTIADTKTPDRPEEYLANGEYDQARCTELLAASINAVVAGFNSTPERPLLCPNFGYMEKHPEWWEALDSSAHPPFAAMQEAGLVQRYGGGLRSFQWDTKVETMRRMKNVAVVMACHGDGLAGQGLERLDAVDTKGNLGPGATGWDGLWFALTSFLMALNEEKTNGYLLFTLWNYADPYWLDEFDPTFLHLGRPLGDYQVRDGVAFREYEDGWVVANKTYGQNRTNLAVPGGGQARVISHACLKNPEAAPLVSSFDLPYYRGVVLLKPGRQLGNSDNPRG
ncbi:MAG: hypothetical protein HUU35_19390 [Armatimonadetes bacterium]|nr:hypothetical protein [Armatimonadota bacterium]